MEFGFPLMFLTKKHGSAICENAHPSVVTHLIGALKEFYQKEEVFLQFICLAQDTPCHISGGERCPHLLLN